MTNMKMKMSLILAAVISTRLVAQQVTNPPPPLALEAPLMLPEATNKTAAKPVKKKAATKPAPKKPAAKSAAKPAAKKSAAPEFKSTPLVAGPSVVVAHHVNVRTRPGLSGEVLTKLTNGEPVIVLEEIKLKRSGPEEPSAWAKIALPTTTHAWVKSSYIDPATKTVNTKKLNLRGGPSENYGVVGQLLRGDVVTEIEKKGDWTQIAPPAGAYAFVAAQYLSQDSAALNGLTGTSTPPPVSTTVPETPTATIVTTDAPPAISTSQIISNELAAAMAQNVTLAPPPVVEDVPPPPRIVQHEGIVRGSTSIQSPTKYELVSPGDRRLINYLYTTSKNLDLSRYKGLHIIVTGEEGLDERWKYTPVITIQKIQVLE
ncbi:MAG: SH3 domain-containing protein [Verrucomicrobiota bacterium]